MWRLPYHYNSVLFTIWRLKLALQPVCCSLKFPFLLWMCSFPRIARKVMEFDFFGHGKSWKVMEFEVPLKSMNPAEQVYHYYQPTWWSVKCLERSTGRDTALYKNILSFSLPLFPFVRGEVLLATFSPPHLIVFSTLLSPVFFFQSSSSPACFTSHLSLGLPRLLLPSTCNSAALFGSLSSGILSTYPAHCSLFLTSISVKLLCTPVSSLNSTILLLSSIFTLAIFRTQLFSRTCSLCCWI